MVLSTCCDARLPASWAWKPVAAPCSVSVTTLTSCVSATLQNGILLGQILILGGAPKAGAAAKKKKKQ